MIEIDDLTYHYAGSAPIFQRFSWRVQPGEGWAVIGPSGCGKTTLLYLLAGLYHPISGTIRIDGAAIRQPRPRSGLVLQDHGLLPWATVRQNVGLGLTIRSFYGSDGKHAPADEAVDADETTRRVDHWLDKLGITELQHQFPSQLSRGQRQRTALARTLVTQPDLLLLDEPFSALDAPTREELQQLVIDLFRETGLVYVIVTHDIEIAVAMGKQILILNKGINTEAHIIENSKAGSTEYRYHADFRVQCHELRRLLETRL